MFGALQMLNCGGLLLMQVGNWSRWLTDTVGIDADDSSVDEHGSDDEIRPDRDGRPQSFPLLNSLSDLLMLPKDMLTDRSIREEVFFQPQAVYLFLSACTLQVCMTLLVTYFTFFLLCSLGVPVDQSSADYKDTL